MNFKDAYESLKKAITSVTGFEFKDTWSEAECITEFSTMKPMADTLKDSNDQISKMNETIVSLQSKIGDLEKNTMNSESVSNLIASKIKESNDKLSGDIRTEFANEIAEVKKLATTATTVVSGDGTPALKTGSNVAETSEEMVDVQTKLFNQNVTVKIPKSQAANIQK